MSKKSSKKHKHSHGSTPPTASLVKAARLIDDGDFEEAVEHLEKITAKHPRNFDAWEMLAEAYTEMNDARGLWTATVENLLRLRPNEPRYGAGAIDAAMMNGLLFVALDYADTFLQRWPDHEFASQVRQLQPKLRESAGKILARELRDPGMTQDDLRLNELTTHYMNMGNHERARGYAQEVLARRPDATAPRNNIALIAMIKGDFEQAVRITNEVLDHQPDNIFAQSQLVQAFVKLGDRERAQQAAERLKQHRPKGSQADFWAKMLEGLSYLGDDQAVVELYEHIQKKAAEALDLPMVAHLAAVALARTGNIDRAKKLWRQALSEHPGHALAMDNLANLAQPEHQRYGAWAFTIVEWLPRAWLQKLTLLAGTASSERQGKRKVNEFIHTLPGFVETLIPFLLDRGDPTTIETMLMICKEAELYDHLREFAQSQRGPDKDRINMMMWLKQEGAVPEDEPMKMWSRGEWTELGYFGFEIVEEQEPDESLSDEAYEILEEAHEALYEQDFEYGEELAREGLALVPDYRVFMNFLSAALYGQNRRKEGDEVIRRMVELHPDYLFAAAAMTRILSREGKHDEAKALLMPFMQRKKFHPSEFAALAAAQIDVCVAAGEKDGAQQWLDMLEATMPDYIGLPALRRQVESPVSMLPSLSRKRK